MNCQFSECRARHAGLSRDTYRYPPTLDERGPALQQAIIAIAHQRRCFGYRRVIDLLRVQGNHKRLFRLYQETNLSVGKARLGLEAAPVESFTLRLAKKLSALALS